MFKKYLDTGLSIVLTIAAVTMAFSVVARGRADRSAGAPPMDPEFYSDWTSWLDRSVLVGHDTAQVTIVQFVDFECPACKQFHNATLKSVLESFGSAVAVRYIHLPLTGIHRFARVAAEASECAAEQGHFGGFVDVVFAKQDSIGLKSWVSFAQEAGVPDAAAFTTCLNSPPAPRVAAGKSIADELGIAATPTVVVNGWRLAGALSPSELSRVVHELLEGRQPYPSTP